MKLWHLSMRKSVGYDRFDSFVIRAETEKAARILAAKYENDNTDWLSKQRATCTEISADGPVEVILGSFNAG